ncbi:MAG: sigma-70 family RNA polymerase sigma factor [Bdellovibrionales bacterium]|nr:sigma-70 family RNA polymerase sigma factor [Bdellovibrionales bacterium]
MLANDETELIKLLIASQAGDNNAYNQFLSRVSVVLVPYVQKKISHSEFLDDIIQDTLIAIHKSRHTYLPGRSLAAWIYVICEHRIIDFYRKYRRVEKSELYLPEEMEKVQISAEDTRSVELYRELEALPEKQRAVIEMMKLEGMRITEIAQKTGMSESAIKVNAFRGYQTLKRILGVKQDEK